MVKEKIKEKITLDNIIVAIALLSLFFTFTNYIPISAVVSVTIIFLPYYMYKERKKMSNLTIIIFAFFSIMAILTMIYDFKSLFQYQFYRRDGNLFITYSPLLILPLIKKNINVEKVLENFLKVTAIIIGLLVIKFFIENGNMLLEQNKIIAFFLFKAHNAAGGYLSTLLCLSIGYFIYNKSIVNAEVIIIYTVALLLTDSRGSIIGVIFALIVLVCTFIPLKKYKIVKNIDIVMFIVAFSSIFIVSTIIMINLGDTVLEEKENEFIIPEELKEYSILFDKIGRSHTVINRTCYLWPRAIKLFTKSPIIGTGFGSYTDKPYNLERLIPNLLEINTGEIKYSDAHAHNSYLHVLAETGLTGFILLMILLYNIRKSILNIDNKNVSVPLYLAFISIVFSSFTEHRLFTPSQVLPFTILLGLCLDSNNRRKEGSINENSNS